MYTLKIRLYAERMEAELFVIGSDGCPVLEEK